MRRIKQIPVVTRQELQDELFSSGICVTKWTIRNEIYRNNLKSRSPQKTPLLLKRHRDARLKFVREHKDKEKSYWWRQHHGFGCFLCKNISVIDGRINATAYQNIL